MKICPKCKRTLPLTKFNWKYTNVQRAVHCKSCSRKYTKEHYKKNREYYLKKAKIRNSKIRNKAYTYIYLYLKTHNCIDCGEKDILVLEFDHKDKTRKIGAVSRIIRDAGSLDKLKEEIDKCEVRCANCHRRKTTLENNGWKLKFAPVA